MAADLRQGSGAVGDHWLSGGGRSAEACQQREAGEGGRDEAEVQPGVEVFCVVHVSGVFQSVMGS